MLCKLFDQMLYTILESHLHTPIWNNLLQKSFRYIKMYHISILEIVHILDIVNLVYMYFQWPDISFSYAVWTKFLNGMSATLMQKRFSFQVNLKFRETGVTNIGNWRRRLRQYRNVKSISWERILNLWISRSCSNWSSSWKAHWNISDPGR